MLKVKVSYENKLKKLTELLGIQNLQAFKNNCKNLAKTQKYAYIKDHPEELDDDDDDNLDD